MVMVSGAPSSTKIGNGYQKPFSPFPTSFVPCSFGDGKVLQARKQLLVIIEETVEFLPLLRDAN
jgi:hypothetical protein